MPKKNETRFYTIREVAKELDLETYVIRYWEKEFPQLKPRRIAGRRFYSLQDLELLKRIKRLLYEEGYTIAGARKALALKTQEPPSQELLKEIRKELEALYKMLS